MATPQSIYAQTANHVWNSSNAERPHGAQGDAWLKTGVHAPIHPALTRPVAICLWRPVLFPPSHFLSFTRRMNTPASYLLIVGDSQEAIVNWHLPVCDQFNYILVASC
jgi:hypothetical protein